MDTYLLVIVFLGLFHCVMANSACPNNEGRPILIIVNIFLNMIPNIYIKSIDCFIYLLFEYGLTFWPITHIQSTSYAIIH